MIFHPQPLNPTPAGSHGSPGYVAVDPLAVNAHWARTMPDRPDCRRIREKQRRIARMVQRVSKELSKRGEGWA